MVDTFTGHSSRSLSRSEVGRLEKRPRRNLPDFGAQSVEHQVAGRPENTADVRNLKAVTLHLQVTYYCYCREPKLRTPVGNDLLGHLVLCLRCIDYISAKACQTFIGYCGRVDGSGQIVCTGNVKI